MIVTTQKFFEISNNQLHILISTILITFFLFMQFDYFKNIELLYLMAPTKMHLKINIQYRQFQSIYLMTEIQNLYLHGFLPIVLTIYIFIQTNCLQPECGGGLK